MPHEAHGDTAPGMSGAAGSGSAAGTASRRSMSCNNVSTSPSLSSEISLFTARPDTTPAGDRTSGLAADPPWPAPAIGVSDTAGLDGPGVPGTVDNGAAATGATAGAEGGAIAGFDCGAVVDRISCRTATDS